MYIVRSVTKYSEQDDYENGCLPGTFQAADISGEFTAETLDELRDKLIQQFAWGDEKAWTIEMQSPDDPGRFDIQVLETTNGNIASDFEIQLWKQGTLKLYLCDYIGRVEQTFPALWMK